MPVTQIKDLTEFNKTINEKGKVVFVDFTATWCGQCKAIAPVFEELAEKTQDTAIFIKVDVDEVEDIAANQNIKATPTFLVFFEGKKVDELVGATKDKLNELIKKHLKK